MMRVLIAVCLGLVAGVGLSAAVSGDVVVVVASLWCGLFLAWRLLTVSGREESR